MVTPTTAALCFLASLIVLAVLYVDLRRRHQRCKRTLDRVAAERDSLREDAWNASQALKSAAGQTATEWLDECLARGAAQRLDPPAHRD